jgi:hypothetical protein
MFLQTAGLCVTHLAFASLFKTVPAKSLGFPAKPAQNRTKPYRPDHPTTTLWAFVVLIPFRRYRPSSIVYRLASFILHPSSLIPFSMWGFCGGYFDIMIRFDSVHPLKIREAIIEFYPVTASNLEDKPQKTSIRHPVRI